MISYETLLEQLDKHIQQAKLASNEQQFREALVATKALCDVVLQLPSTSTPSSTKVQYSESTVSTPSAVIHTQRPLKEDDANGESIFDF